MYSGFVTIVNYASTAGNNAVPDHFEFALLTGANFLLLTGGEFLLMA